MPLHKVTDPADPRRCKGSIPTGQCMNIAEEGLEYCVAHAGAGSVMTIPAGTRLYMLAKSQDRFRHAELTDHENLKSLSEEVALARLMLERYWNSIKDDDDLQMKWPAIQQGLLTIHKMVKDCQVLEHNLGALINRSTVYRLAQTVVQILIERLSQANIPGWEDIVKEVSDNIAVVISSAQNDEPIRSSAMLPGPADK